MKWFALGMMVLALGCSDTATRAECHTFCTEKGARPTTTWHEGSTLYCSCQFLVRQ
jgi:hypothetical protein